VPGAKIEFPGRCKRIRVLQVICHLNIGGVQRQLLKLLPRLNSQKYDVSILCVRNLGELMPLFVKEGFPVHLIVIKRVHLLRNFFKLVKFMREGRFDIVHTHMYDANTPARVAAKLAGVPGILAHEHNIENWKGKRQKIMDRFLANFTDKIIAVSQGVKNFLIEEEGIPEKKIEVVYNGVDLGEFDDVRVDIEDKKKEFGIAPQEKVVGMVSRIVPQKGHKYFLQAAAEILKVFPDTKFLIVGGGKRALEEEIKRLTKELGIEKQVIFAGYREDIPEILPLLDVFAFPSEREGFPNALLEVMVAEKSIVATDIPGVNEIIIEGENGFLVPPKDSKALADRIITLLKDTKLRRRMGKRGRERVRDFSMEEVKEKIEALYDGLVQSKQTGY